MPYVKPTVDQFTERFPIFEDRDEDQIQICIDEASRSVDDGWVEADYQPAILYLAAHLLVTDFSQTGEQVGGTTGQGAVTSESFGGMSISYATEQANSLTSSAEFGSTSYGRRYLTLLRNNNPPIVVI